MRRVLAAFALLLLPGLALAEQPRTNAFSTAGAVQWGQALTDAGYFGIPRTATASLPTCNTANKGAARFDTTLGGVIVCNGTAWTSIGSSSGPILFPNGTELLPSVAIGVADSGFWNAGSGRICGVSTSGASRWCYIGNSFLLASNVSFGWASTTDPESASLDLILQRATTAQLQLGANATSSTVDQIISAADAVTSADISGSDLTIQSGTGMGTGTVSALIFQTPTVAAAGANPQSLATRLTINSNGLISAGNIEIPNANLLKSASFGNLVFVADGTWAVRTAASNITHFEGGGTAVASATALPVPTGSVVHVTGTTTVTSITATGLANGACFTLIFDGVLTFTDGSNLKLAGNFVTTADDTISLCFDGTNFYETARAVN